MALTDIYVDPSIAANSGTGTIGDPYGDLQYALNTASHDTTNGTRFNVKSGATEVLASNPLNFSTYFTNSGGIATFSATAPLVIRGYSSTPEDGGRGVINCNGFQFINSTVIDNVKLVDLEIYGCTGTTNAMITGDGGFSIHRCILHTCNGAATNLDGQDIVSDCYIYNYALTTGGYAIDMRGNSMALNNWIEATSNGASGIGSETNTVITGNVIWLRGASATGRGINANGDSFVSGNTIVAENGSTGPGIGPRYTTGDRAFVENNVISGFATAIDGDDVRHVSIRGNIFHNCTTGIDVQGHIFFEENNYSTTDPIFENAAIGDFRLVSGYRSSSHPQAFLNGTARTNNDAGPIQHADPVGGGGGGGALRCAGNGGGLVSPHNL